jgi:hypothetical protein
MRPWRYLFALHPPESPAPIKASGINLYPTEQTRERLTRGRIYFSARFACAFKAPEFDWAGPAPKVGPAYAFLKAKPASPFLASPLCVTARSQN